VQNKTKFYTGLFHALLGRGIASDVNGAYPKHGGLTGQLPAQTDKNLKAEFINTMPFGAVSGTLPSYGHYPTRNGTAVL
jgi:hypothetical protein